MIFTSRETLENHARSAMKHERHMITSKNIIKFNRILQVRALQVEN